MDDTPARLRAAAMAIQLEPLRLPALQSLRLCEADDDAVRRASEAIGFELARPANRLTTGSPRTARLGPGEWLVFGGNPVAMAEALGSTPHQAHEVGAGQVGWRICGAKAADLINAGCSIDLHEAVFPAGTCVRTLMAKVGVLLSRPDVRPAFEIIVEASLEHYLAAWLEDTTIGLE